MTFDLPGGWCIHPWDRGWSQSSWAIPSEPLLPWALSAIHALNTIRVHIWLQVTTRLNQVRMNIWGTLYSCMKHEQILQYFSRRVQEASLENYASY